MDTIAIIIVTAFVNIAISNFLFYRYQKNIDLSFAQRLKEFESKLQYLNFEQQTKFARVYEKKVEVLKTLYQKFKEFCDAQTTWVMEVVESKKNNVDDLEDQGKKVIARMDDFSDYFEATRHDLPDNVSREIDRIWESAVYWEKMVGTLLFSEHDPVNARGSAYMVYRLADELESLYKSEADINLESRKVQAA